MGRHFFVHRKVVFLADEFISQLHPFVHSLQKTLEYRIAKGDIALFEHVVQFVAPLFEFINVALIEIQLHRIEAPKE